jgi:polysaccharide biosynthesis transport protein
MANQDEIELRWIFGVLRRWVWLILGCTALAGLAALFVTAQIAPVYEANVTLLVEPSKNTMSSEYSAIIAAERLALTYTQMLTSRPVMEAIIVELGLDETANELAKKVSAASIRDTQLIKVTVQAESPEKAAELANSLADAFTEYVQSLAVERYSSSLANVQEKMDVASEGIQSVQAQIDALRLSSSESEAELGRLQGLLAQYQSDLRTLQANYHSLRLSIAQSSDKVKIVEPAQVPSGRTQPPFTATVTLLFDESLLTGGGGSSSTNRAPLASTYGPMLYGRSVLEEVIEKLELGITPVDLAKLIQANAITNTQLLQVSVQDSEQAQAILLANILAETFVEQIQAQLAIPYLGQLSEMEIQIDDLTHLVEDTQASVRTLTAQNAQAGAELAQLEGLLAEHKNDYRDLRANYDNLLLTSVEAADAVYVAEQANIPSSPATNRLLYISLAVAVGAMIGLATAFLLEYMDDTIKPSDDIARLLGLGTLGKIGSFSNADRRVVVITDPRSPVGEDFRVLSSNIRFATLDQPVRSLLVTSPSPMEGKSSVLANLAVTLARSETSVVAVDADLRLPKLHKLFDLEPGSGLTGALMARNPNCILQEVNVKGLKVLTSGKLPGNPSEVIGSARMRRLLEELRQQADLMLIDAPPVLPFADASILASQSDGVILVLRANETRRKAAQDALESLQKAGARILGIVLNDVSARADGYYRYSHYNSGRSKSILRKLMFWKR